MWCVEQKFHDHGIATVATIIMVMDLIIITAEDRDPNAVAVSTTLGTKDSSIGEAQFCDRSTITNLLAI